MAKYKRYQSVVNDNIVKITDLKHNNIKQYDIRNFVYGQIMYDKKTNEYPNYIHNDIWNEYNKQKKIQLLKMQNRYNVVE